jgi:hypothetical protein
MNSRLKMMFSAKSPRGWGDEMVTGAPVRRRGARGGLIVALLAACLCGPVTAAWAAPASAPIAQPTGASPSTQPTHAAAPESGYAAREAESKDLENFKGGEPVVIVTSTAVLIVAIIILVLLI